MSARSVVLWSLVTVQQQCFGSKCHATHALCDCCPGVWESDIMARPQTPLCRNLQLTTSKIYHGLFCAVQNTVVEELQQLPWRLCYARDKAQPAPSAAVSAGADALQVAISFRNPFLVPCSFVVRPQPRLVVPLMPVKDLHS